MLVERFPQRPRRLQPNQRLLRAGPIYTCFQPRAQQRVAFRGRLDTARLEADGAAGCRERTDDVRLLGNVNPDDTADLGWQHTAPLISSYFLAELGSG